MGELAPAADLFQRTPAATAKAQPTVDGAEPFAGAFNGIGGHCFTLVFERVTIQGRS